MKRSRRSLPTPTPSSSKVSAVRGGAGRLKRVVGRVQMFRESHGPAWGGGGGAEGRPKEENKGWEDCVGAGSVLQKVSLFSQFINCKGLCWAC